jgi:hypothetical protein
MMAHGCHGWYSSPRSFSATKRIFNNTVHMILQVCLQFTQAVISPFLLLTGGVCFIIILMGPGCILAAWRLCEK